MEALPDLGSLSDADLRQLIHELVEEEHQVSYRRRMLHGRIDILRAELVVRLQKGHRSGESGLQVDVERLTAILTGKGAPPLEDPAS
ncbi:MAG: hypothetical protein H0V40_12520 [Actinobacteria bacterium]|nr:hypothetical protein [Actinomycetota bacterium]